MLYVFFYWLEDSVVWLKAVIDTCVSIWDIHVMLSMVCILCITSVTLKKILYTKRKQIVSIEAKMKHAFLVLVMLFNLQRNVMWRCVVCYCVDDCYQ